MAEAGGLNPLQHGFESHRGHCMELLAPVDCSLRSLRIALESPPPSSSLADGEALSARSVYSCSLRSLRMALVSRCLPHSLADEKRVCSLARPGSDAQSWLAARRAIRGAIARSAFDCSLPPHLCAGVSRLKTANVARFGVWHPVSRLGMGNADRAVHGVLNKAHSCFKAGRTGPCPAFQ